MLWTALVCRMWSLECVDVRKKNKKTQATGPPYPQCTGGTELVETCGLQATHSLPLFQDSAHSNDLDWTLWGIKIRLLLPGLWSLPTSCVLTAVKLFPPPRPFISFLGLLDPPTVRSAGASIKTRQKNGHKEPSGVRAVSVKCCRSPCGLEHSSGQCSFVYFDSCILLIHRVVLVLLWAAYISLSVEEPPEGGGGGGEEVWNSLGLLFYF